MRFQIRTPHECTASLSDWENFPPDESDQYTPKVTAKGVISCSIGLDPTTGSLVLRVDDLLDVLGIVVITNAKNRDDIVVTQPDVYYSAFNPIPQINAYGQIYGYSYRLGIDGTLN